MNAVLAQIMTAVENNPTVQRNTAVELIVDAIFAQGYRPDERLDADLSERIYHWIQAQWTAGDIKFAEYATTTLANLNCSGITQYLLGVLETDQRPHVQKQIRNCLRERGE